MFLAIVPIRHSEPENSLMRRSWIVIAQISFDSSDRHSGLENEVLIDIKL